jgi:regulator of sigma E protease
MEFRSKPAQLRLIIMLGGVTVNFILAVIYIGMAFCYGDLYLKNSELKDGVAVTSEVGEELGFKTGDKILEIDGEKMDPLMKFREKYCLPNRWW